MGYAVVVGYGLRRNLVPQRGQGDLIERGAAASGQPCAVTFLVNNGGRADVAASSPYAVLPAAPGSEYAVAVASRAPCDSVGAAMVCAAHEPSVPGRSVRVVLGSIGVARGAILLNLADHG